MKSIWVWKYDGTIQCETDKPGTPLDEMRQQLVSLIGAENVLSMTKGQRPVIELCGRPTGKTNCFEITNKGFDTLQHGIMGPCGFEVMEFGPQGEFNPIFIRDLPGYRLRVLKPGDPLHEDFDPMRFNIQLSKTLAIVRIWFG